MSSLGIDVLWGWDQQNFEAATKSSRFSEQLPQHSRAHRPSRAGASLSQKPADRLAFDDAEPDTRTRSAITLTRA
jgi:hypothetical protein